MAYGFASGQEQAPPTELQTADGRGVTVDDRDNAGALGAVQNSSDRTTGNSSDMALSSRGFDDTDWKGQISKMKESIPEGLRGMFAGQLQALEMVMSVMDMLKQNGVQGQGGELGNPQANLAPPATGVEQPSQDLQLANR